MEVNELRARVWQELIENPRSMQALSKEIGINGMTMSKFMKETCPQDFKTLLMIGRWVIEQEKKRANQLTIE